MTAVVAGMVVARYLPEVGSDHTLRGAGVAALAAAVSGAVTSWGSGGGTARSVAWVTPPERSDPVATVGP